MAKGSKFKKRSPVSWLSQGLEKLLLVGIGLRRGFEVYKLLLDRCLTTEASLISTNYCFRKRPISKVLKKNKA